jgi:hypothetical protein
VSTFQVSEDSSSVIYVADQDDNGVQQLYHVPSEGGSTTRINPSLVTGGDVASGLFMIRLPALHITPDSSSVLYLADQDTDGVLELYAVWIQAEEDGPTLGSSLAEVWQESHFTLRELSNPWKKSTIWGWNADPDCDGLTNLMEYALGGNPQVSSHQFADGSVMGAELKRDGFVATASFPVRTDAWARGLEYELEFSNDCENWLPGPPEGISFWTESDYAPTVAGFRQDAQHWIALSDRIFVRLRISFVTWVLF